MTFSIVPELPGDRDRGEVALPSDILLELLLLEQLTVGILDGRDSWSKWGGLGWVRLRVRWIFAPHQGNVDYCDHQYNTGTSS